MVTVLSYQQVLVLYGGSTCCDGLILVESGGNYSIDGDEGLCGQGLLFEVICRQSTVRGIKLNAQSTYPLWR